MIIGFYLFFWIFAVASIVLLVLLMVYLFNQISNRPAGSRRGLYRSRNDRIIAGVCGGIAEQLNISPLLVRLLWVLCGFGIIAYIICAIVIPEEP